MGFPIGAGNYLVFLFWQRRFPRPGTSASHQKRTSSPVFRGRFAQERNMTPFCFTIPRWQTSGEYHDRLFEIAGRNQILQNAPATLLDALLLAFDGSRSLSSNDLKDARTSLMRPFSSAFRVTSSITHVIALMPSEAIFSLSADCERRSSSQWSTSRNFFAYSTSLASVVLLLIVISHWGIR